MPIPKPHSGESQEAFLARCHSALAGEYPDEAQRHAICMSQMDKAMQLEALLKAIHGRTGVDGVLTADRFFRSIEGCFDGGFCPTKLFSAASQEQWAAALKEAENQLTFTHADLTIAEDRIEKEVSDRPNLLMAFECTITTPRRDRDKDVLMTAGFNLDPKAPLLWQHISLQPLGPQLGSAKSKDRLRGRFGISDTELGNDTAVLIEDGALRISHGFIPTEFEPLEDEGWLFKAGEIYEVSVVSVPSNLDAVIENFVRNKLRNSGVRAWAKSLHDARPVQGVGVTLETPAATEAAKEASTEHVCSCQKKADESQKDAEEGQCPACGYRAALGAFRGSDLGMESETESFEPLRKRLVELAFKQEPRVVKHAYLTLKDAHEILLASQKEREWKEAGISEFLEGALR